ncbi:ferritin-like domain-containing protein [Burkholderia sp. PU8-34]
MNLTEKVRLLHAYQAAQAGALDTSGTSGIDAASLLEHLPHIGLDATIPTLDRTFGELADVIGSTDIDTDRKNLLEDLQQALILEHATIPPYLTALYTLAPNSGWRAVEVLRSVVVEEMLHMTLVANVMNALGGAPQTSAPTFIPAYPAPLPFDIDGIKVNLFGFSRDAVVQGCAIERPRTLRGNVLFRAHPVQTDMTIGEFYVRIQAKLCGFVHRYGAARTFIGDPSRQVGEGFYYDGAGATFPITDQLSAQFALETIRDQGEGVSDTIWTGNRERYKSFPEVAHFFRFNELLAGREYQRGDTVESGPTGKPLEVDWGAAIPIRPNSKLEDYRDAPEILAHAQAFNVTYWDFLRTIERAFNGEPALLQQGIGRMFTLKDLFLRLVNNPLPGQATRLHAAPTFEYAPPASSDAALS